MAGHTRLTLPFDPHPHTPLLNFTHRTNKLTISCASLGGYGEYHGDEGGYNVSGYGGGYGGDVTQCDSNRDCGGDEARGWSNGIQSLMISQRNV